MRISFHTCDKRRALSELKPEFEHVDFTEVISESDPMWTTKEDSPNDLDSDCARWRSCI